MTTANVPEARRLITDAQATLDLALAALGDAGPSPPAGMYPAACHDRDPRDKPPLPILGAAGYRFNDPAFGTPLIRATDETIAGGASFRVPSNAHLAAWNADATKFVLVGNAGTKAFAWDGTTPRPIADIKSQCEPCWSRRDPAVLYGVGGPQTRTIQAFVFDGDALAHTVDLLDLDTLDLGLDEPRTYVGGLVTSDDAIVVFFGGEGQDKHCYVGQLQIGADTLAWILDTRTLGFLLHSVAGDRTGQYVSLYPTNAKPYHTVIVDLVANASAPITISPGGHDALGYGWLVNADSGTQEWDAAQWQRRPLDALDDRVDLITPVLRPKEVYLSEHSTWNNARADALLPILSATFRYNNEAADWRAWDDEVLAVATDGPSDVARFCHHRSDSRDEANPANTYFWYQPIANVSQDGRWLLFTSNWEKTLGADTEAGRSRQDVFIVALEGGPT